MADNSPYGRGYYGDDDPRYREPGSETPDPTTPPPTPATPETTTPPPTPATTGITPPETTPVSSIAVDPNRSDPTSVVANNPDSQNLNDGLKRILFQLYQYNKEMLREKIRETETEIASISESAKKTQKTGILGELKQTFGDLTDVFEDFVDNMEDLNKEMEKLSDRTRGLGMNMKKTSYQTELTNEITRREARESKNVFMQFIDGMMGGYFNVRGIVDREKVVSEKRTEVDSVVAAAIAKANAGDGSATGRAEAPQYASVEAWLEAQGAGYSNPNTPIPVPPNTSSADELERYVNIGKARAGTLDADIKRRLGIASDTQRQQQPDAAKKFTGDGDIADLAKRFIKRTSYEPGKMQETVEAFLKKSDDMIETVLKTAGSSISAWGDEYVDIFKSLAMDIYELSDTEEEYSQKLKLLLKKINEEGMDVEILKTLDETGLNKEDRKEYIADILSYDTHMLMDTKTTKKTVTEEIGRDEAERRAAQFTERIRAASGKTEKDKIIQEATRAGFKVQVAPDVGHKVESKKQQQLDEQALRYNERLRLLGNDPENQAEVDRIKQEISSNLDLQLTDTGEVVVKTNEALEGLNQEAVRLTRALNNAATAAEKQAIVSGINTDTFDVQNVNLETTEKIIKAVIETRDAALQPSNTVQAITEFMNVNKEIETTESEARDATEMEKARIERKTPSKKKNTFEGQTKASTKVLKNQELMEEKESILTQEEGYIKNKSDRKVFRDKLLPGVSDASMAPLAFQKKARNLRLSTQEGLFFGDRLDKSGLKPKKLLENFKQGVIGSSISEAKYEAKAGKTDFIKEKVSSMTTSALTGGMMNKLLLLVPGIGPALSIGWTVISGTFSALLSVGKFIFGMVGKVFKVLGEVLSKLLELGMAFLKGFVKYGTIALVAWVLLFHTNLKDKIMPMVTGLIKKVTPIIFGFLTTILRYVNEALEGLVVDLNKMLEGGIYDIPRKIFEFFFGENGMFGEETGFGALTSELGRLGNNLVEVGGVLLDALKALGVAMYDYFVDIVWPLYMKPAFSSLRDSVIKWGETEFGKMVNDYLIYPLMEGVDMFLVAARTLFDFIMDIVSSDVLMKQLSPDTQRRIIHARGKLVAEKLGFSPSERANLSDDALERLSAISMKEVNRDVEVMSRSPKDFDPNSETGKKLALFDTLLQSVNGRLQNTEAAEQTSNIIGDLFAERIVPGDSNDRGIIGRIMVEALSEIIQSGVDMSLGQGRKGITEEQYIAGIDERINTILRKTFISAEEEQKFILSPEYSEARRELESGRYGGDHAMENKEVLEEKAREKYFARLLKESSKRDEIDEARKFLKDFVDYHRAKTTASKYRFTGIDPVEIVAGAGNFSGSPLERALTQPAIPGGGSFGDYRQDVLGGGAHTQGVMIRHLDNLRGTYANATKEQQERIKRKIASNPQSVFQVSGDDIGFSPQYANFQEGNFSTGNRPIPEELKKLGYAVNNEGYISNKIGIDTENQNREIKDYIEASGIDEKEKQRRIDLLNRVGLHQYDESNKGVLAAPGREEGDRGTNINELMGEAPVLSADDVEKQTEWASAYSAEQENIISQVGQESRSLESAIRENTAATKKNTGALAPQRKPGSGKTLYDMFFGSLFGSKSSKRKNRMFSREPYDEDGEEDAMVAALQGDNNAMKSLIDGEYSVENALGTNFSDTGEEEEPYAVQLYKSLDRLNRTDKDIGIDPTAISSKLNLGKALASPQQGSNIVNIVGSNNISTTNVSNSGTQASAADNVHSPLAYTSMPMPRFA